MRPLKTLLKKRQVQYLLCFLVAMVVKLLHATLRMEQEMPEETKALIEKKQPVIFIFWHGRLLVLPAECPRIPQYYAVVSSHSDGELLSRFLRYFGVGLVRGSSRKKGMQALKEAIARAKEGYGLVITPDGPRGPRMRLQGNVAAIAAQTGLPVVGAVFSASRCKIFTSWDRFMLPFPFSRGVVRYTAPFYVEAGLNASGLKKTGIKLETALNNITREADIQMGLAPVEPHPIAKNT